jgi:hypothetical protein
MLWFLQLTFTIIRHEPNYVRGLINETVKMSLADFSKRISEPTFERSAEAIPKKTNLSGLWTSLTHGSDFIIRSDNEDLIFIERVIPMEHKQIGIFNKCELRKEGSKFIGRCRLGTPCSYFVPFIGTKNKFCYVDTNMEILSFTETRIEGQGERFENVDCRTCSPVGRSPSDFTWIRK